MRKRYWWCRHTGSLTSYMATKLAGLKHGNGTPVCILYGNHHRNNDDDHHHQAVSGALMSWSSFVRIWNLHLQVLNLSHTKCFGLSSSLVHACFLQQQNYWGLQCNQGPIVTFNLKRADGSWVGYREVEKLAALSNIQLRVSCFQDATSSSKQAICKRK